MIAAWRTVARELARPDDQGRDWYAWGTAQLAHAAIGVALAGAACLAGLAPVTAALVAGGGYAVAKELPDLLRAPGWRTARDCLRDALFVAGGAAVAAALHAGSVPAFAWAVAAVLIGLAVGVYQRVTAQ